jgi:hypothetical protein
MGGMALGIGLFIVVYLAGHRALDSVSQAIAMGTAALCFAFGGYVLIRRIRRGPQH